MKTNEQKIKDLQDEIDVIKNFSLESEPLRDYIIATNEKKIKELLA